MKCPPNSLPQVKINSCINPKPKNKASPVVGNEVLDIKIGRTSNYLETMGGQQCGGGGGRGGSRQVFDMCIDWWMGQVVKRWFLEIKLKVQLY